MNDIFENTETMQENEHPRFYTAESVMRGHPDKLCDLIADSVLDACLQHDPASRVACEVMATHGHIIVAGEITTSAKPDVFNIFSIAFFSNGGIDAPIFSAFSRILPNSDTMYQNRTMGVSSIS